MANSALFSTKHVAKVSDTKNEAGGAAYKLADAEALCQYVVTSTFNDAYYVSAKEQLDEVARICNNVDPVIIAKAAVYGQETGGMKDVPAYLLAVLSAKGELDLLRSVFPRVIRSPKMLLNFVQIVRSGVTGRKSFGTAVKNLICQWITSRSGDRLFLASIGYTNPSLADVIKMVHPRPTDEEQNALFGYILGKDYQPGLLPALTKQFEAFKKDNTAPMPDMDYRSLTNCNLTDDHWKQIAMNMPWNTLRMNLRNLNKHGVFLDDDLARTVADRLRDPEQIQQWNVFPYQLLTTFQNTTDLPSSIKLALQDALDIACNNVPVLGNKVAVCVDVSGSMRSPATGSRPGMPESKTSCGDVAALMASSIARTNPETDVIAFGTHAALVQDFNPRDSIVSNSTNLSRLGDKLGYGTNIANAMNIVCQKKYDFVLFVGDSQSWMDHNINGKARSYYKDQGTSLSTLWESFKKKNKRSKLAEIVVGPYATTQAPTSDPRVMNIGGFSDAVFDVLKEFAHRNDNTNFLNVISAVKL